MKQARVHLGVLAALVAAALLVATFSGVAGGESHPTSRPEKLDAVLGGLLAELEGTVRVPPPDESQEYRVRPRTILEGRDTLLPIHRNEAGITYVDVLMKSSGSREGYDDLGVVVHSNVGDVMAATVPLESMAQLSTLPGVEVMEGARRLFPTNDVGVPETGAPIFRNATGQDGTGVIVGVIDTGVDFTHPDFRNLDGSTRIIFLCDQTDPPQPTDETCPGGGSAAGDTLWTQAQINAALAGAGTVRQRDLERHGTHVLGSAAGNDGTFGGMAPGADIVVVKAGDSGFSTANILSAIDFIDAVAAGLGSPYVINMSLGGHIGPHDGTDLQSQAINSLTGPGNPGKVDVVAAGNEGGDDIHASGNVASGTQSVSFNIPTGTEVAFIDIWYDGQNSFSFGFLDPNNSGIASLVSPGQASAVLCNGPSICLQAFHSTPQDNTNGDIEVFFVIFSSIGGPIGLPGIWSFSLTGAGAFDAWISCVNGFCEFSGGDTQLTIGEPGVAAGAITVGSYATKDCWPSIAGGDFCFFPLPTIGGISGFSSRGPTRDGRVKPDIAAPGQVVVSALSSDAVFDQPLIAPDNLHLTLQGTSMATPQVAGAVALLLAENPNLDAGQIKTILQDSAFRDAFTDPGCTNTWGCGKLDISALAATLQTLVSDSLDRADADRCALGEADLALGGAGSHFYLPLWPTAGVDPSNPIGANIVSNALQNNGLDFGGVQYTASSGACASTAVRGEDVGQDINISVELLVPTDGSGNVTQAGPYFRGRASARGDGLIGGQNAGYWARLHSTGEVNVKNLSNGTIVAFSGTPPTFDTTVFHTLETAAQGTNLQVALDGKLLTFDQGGNLVTTLSIPPTAGSNAGTAGISFGAEDNRGQIGGQRADDLVVASFSSLAGLPVQDNLTPATLTVNSTGDASDSSTGDGLCDTGALVGGQPECTLRGAIEEANALSGANTIEFDIPGAGPHTIQPASALPTVTDPVVIDGYTQPGASPNTNGPGLGLNTVLMIELDGTSAGTSFVPGLDITGGSSIVRGLIINRFSGSGIRLQTSGNVVDGNFIGTDVTGTVAAPNSNPGVSIIAAGNIIGGTGSGARNVISGNESNGVGIVGGMSTGNQILGNFIGTDVSGAAALGNRFPAVSIFNAADNTIGGTSPGAGNVVSGNDSEGILINGVGAVGNLVQGNSIGTDVTGTASLGNVFQGVDIRDNASDNTIGGTAEGAGNTIAFNGGIGVLAVSGTGNGILGNSIFSNAQLGIDLELDGVPPNDVGDGDTGANNLQNFPVLTAAVSGSTAIQGTLNSMPDTTFRLEFFSNSACDASGHGEGETFLGSTDVTTNGSGDASFTAGFPATVPVGHFITSTATDPGNNTSEFSQCVVVNASPLAFDQTVATTPDTPATITLSGLDASTSASLSTIIVSLPRSGDLFEGITDIITTPHTLTGDTVTYTPDPGFSGDDSFTFLVNNGAGDSNVATVTVNVTSGQHVVQGQVRLEGRTDHAGARVTFSGQDPVFTNSSGGFQTELPADTYDVTVEADGFLRATRLGVEVLQNTVLPDAKLLGGDFNLDGTVGFDDLLIPVRNLGKTGSGLAGDANLDGVVAIDDVVIPAKNLDKAESPWP